MQGYEKTVPLAVHFSMQTVVHVGALSVQFTNEKCTSVVKTWWRMLFSQGINLVQW